ncbi:non-hydrolyzing UDP-N-acetylglucosamine 2-epimerase [Flavobacterium sp. GT3R68]|uniref:non-hydrolyzing UDP-N-acetylglucosamine 2-epimerase n=1 Tax=Flavobacterium sp. GT3R68 TaxID=2594437 RepID=UPI000F896285|nr:UDP-N-acetylglucosamine 2-epimerase (non-hydrolyzing) [Flavobacterium sp. GT3R68]RTY92265.1 UDP-N-acetylglucosamine 2-epimerase (non-hydrolyzing) [Flavobacterium sp. GSN2]TRW92501.1 UDP-N-acetylglucosamine 2-epimerase (non-hydrolyzing) [Flavobacterium sp. GT3R68]
MGHPKKILLCFGTRPEAIKMAPLFHELKKSPFDIEVCVTAQHREMLDQVLDFFEIDPDYDLDLMQPNQSLNELGANILSKIDKVLTHAKPDLVLVHGDTTTSSMVALAAFHLGIKVGHVEAGLRTYNKWAPFPEEINRQLTSRIADIHFTPTTAATQNLLKEGILQKDIIATGNTVIDALLWTVEKIESHSYSHPEIEELKKNIPASKKLILVTGHRRENFGEGFKNLCQALLSVSERNDVAIIYPVHLNPNVRDVVHDKLANKKNIYLIPPVSYPAFVWLMKQSFLIVTDSGGIQEEAPTLGKPVLVTRNVSERPEGVNSGFSTLVGTSTEKIIDNIQMLLDHFTGFENPVNPYGKGDASKIITAYLINQN